MKAISRFILFFTVIMLQGCQYFQQKQDPKAEDGEVLARVGEQFLYASDVGSLIDKRMTTTDSANIISRYIDSWIKKQLMLQAAENNFNYDETDIERKVLDYRYQLIVYGYEKQFVEQNLDTAITEEEISVYYEENKDNFQLKQNIVKGIYLKVPEDAPRIPRVKRWLRSSDEVDKERLRSYVYSFADAYSLDDSLWIDFDEFVFNTPFSEQITNPVQTLERNQYLETSDSLYVYLMKINEYKISDQVSPMEYVREQIKNILLNRRVVELRKQLEDKVYEEAQESNDYEIYY